jgi:hypothetical protein
LHVFRCLNLQGYDSLTEQSSAAPISRENARSGHNMISDPVGALSATNSSSALAAQPASWSHNPYYNPSTGGLELAGVQSPGLQSPVSHSPTHAAARQQQQQLAAPGMQAMQAGVPQQWSAAVPRQQQQQRTFSPLGGGAAGSPAAVSPEHVGLELPAAAAAAANGNSWGSGSSGSKQQQQHAEYSLTSPRGVAHTQQQQQQQQRSLPPELAGGFGAGVSAQTEYTDAKSRQSEGSWASGREEPE